MPSYVTPKKNAAFVFTVSLPSIANAGKFQVNPTLAAGDVKVIKDGGTPANIGTLPTAISSGAALEVSLTSSEMNADNVDVLFSDAAGDEWGDVLVSIQTTAQQIDDLASQASVDTIGTNVDAIQTDTQDLQTQIGTDGAGLTNIPWNSSWDAQVQSEVTDALNAYDPPTKAELDSAVSPLATSSALATVDGNVDSILTDTGTTLPAQISGLNDIAAADVWSVGTREITGGAIDTNNDKTGYSISGTLTTLDALDSSQDAQHMTTQSNIAALNDISAAQVNAQVDTALSDYDAPTKAEMDAAFAALNDPTAATIADAVLDEALSGHAGAGTLGKAIADIESDATAILADTNELQTNQGNWATATGFSTHSAADVVTAMQAAADDFKADVSGLATSTALSTVDANVDAILEDTGTTLPASIAALNDISTADVNAQVLDVLNTDTFGEPTGVPAASNTLAEKLGYIYMALRNRVTVTDSAKNFHDNAGNVEWSKALSDDGTTYTEDKGA